MNSPTRDEVSRWFQAPPVTGWLALPCGIVLVGIPTLIRLMVAGVVTGCEFTPYLPFVLLSAILLRWWQAGAVALTAVAILGGLFGGAPTMDLQCFVSGAGVFLGAAAMMIGIAVLLRRMIAALGDEAADDSLGGFRLTHDKGEVWASWRGGGRPLRLGSRERVARLMKAFLADDPADKDSR